MHWYKRSHTIETQVLPECYINGSQDVLSPGSLHTGFNI